MRDVQAFAFMAALCLVLPAFLLRLRESTRLLWRLLFFAAMAVNMTACADLTSGNWRWFYNACAVVWWLSVIGCWHRMEAARQREAIIARLRKDGAQ